MDWREAFIKYLHIVGLAEGVTFLYPDDWGEDWPHIFEAEREEASRDWPSS